MAMLNDKPPQPWLTRIAWFVVLWLGGVGAVSAMAYGLRLWIAPH